MRKKEHFRAIRKEITVRVFAGNFWEKVFRETEPKSGALVIYREGIGWHGKKIALRNGAIAGVTSATFLTTIIIAEEQEDSSTISGSLRASSERTVFLSRTWVFKTLSEKSKNKGK